MSGAVKNVTRVEKEKKKKRTRDRKRRTKAPAELSESESETRREVTKKAENTVVAETIQRSTKRKKLSQNEADVEENKDFVSIDVASPKSLSSGPDSDDAIPAQPDHDATTRDSTKPEEDDDAAEDAFRRFYLSSVTKEFADDLETIRNANDFGEGKVPVLVEALQQGIRCFTKEERVKAGRQLLAGSSEGN